MIPVPHGWRSRLFFLTRQPRFLWLGTVGIIVAGLLISALVVVLKKGSFAMNGAVLAQSENEVTLADALKAADGPKNRALLRWLIEELAWSDVEEDEDVILRHQRRKPFAGTIEGFLISGELMKVPLRPVIQQCAVSSAEQALFEDFIVASLDAKDERGHAAWKRIESAALGKPAVPLANEFLGHLLLFNEMQMEALNALRREGVFADATFARRSLLNLAVHLRETGTLRELIYTEPYRSEASAHVKLRAGDLLGDFLLHWTGVLQMELEHLRLDNLIITLLATWLWAAVLVRFGPRLRWRWLSPLLPIIAGVISVWPTMLLIHVQDDLLGYTENAPFPHDLIYLIVGVGLREELCKLALFALFIPWLLKVRRPGAAMITGGFVGLGFAMDENLGYYLGHGLHVAPGRLLTANFMHMAMTAFTADALYELARSRFGSAQQFIMTFFAIVVAHGVYDWTPEQSFQTPLAQGSSIIGIFVLAGLARQLFDHLEAAHEHRRSTVSLLALFLFGSAAVVALAMIFTAMEIPLYKSVLTTLASAGTLIPIAIFYLRRIGYR